MKAAIITGTEKEMATLAKELGNEEGIGELIMLREPYQTVYSLLRVRRDDIVSVESPEAPEAQPVWRRFVPLTENKTQAARLAKLLDNKGLTREDLILILTTIGLSPESLGIEEVSHVADQNDQDQPV